MKDSVAGTRIAERLLVRSEGATMDEITAASGRTQYNTLKRLERRGYRIRKVKEGSSTRYFADPPASRSVEATVTRKGQLTIPREVRERLRLRAGGKVQFNFEDGDRIVVSATGHRLSDLFGMLGRPARNLTIEDMDNAISQAAVERHLRSKR